MAEQGTSAGPEDNTRRRILGAAEALFSEKGPTATSVRAITRAAGCNVAAVNYHFGGKDNLYVETMRRLLSDMRDEFVERITTLHERTSVKAGLEDFLERFVTAAVEMFGRTHRGRNMLAYCQRGWHRSQGPPPDYIEVFLLPVMTVSIDQLQRLGLSLDANTARFCLVSLWSQIIVAVNMMGIADRNDPQSDFPVDLSGLASHIVRFSSAGISACVNQTSAVGGGVVTTETEDNGDE
jgi:AcrR family transcriptional regulator